MDDYHKKRDEIPIVEGMANWDDPVAVDFEKLISDLSQLKKGKSITVQTKNERFNPRAKEIGRISMEIQPKKIILLEGYLSLWDPTVRQFLGCKIFLDIPHQNRMKRRTKFMDPIYEEKILIPMHHAYVEPTKEFADYLIDVSNLTPAQVFYEVEKIIFKYFSEKE